MRLLGYIAARVGIALFTMFAVSLIVFVAMRMLPGGFEMIVLGTIQTEEVRGLITEKFGLDRPLPIQFFSWLLAVLQGDFGRSMITQLPVAEELLRRAPATIQLALMSVVAALVVGLPLGVLAGIGDASRKVKIGARLIGATGASTPDFVLGTALVYAFSVWALGPTVGGYVPFFEDPFANLRAMLLPTLTLSVFGIALILRTTRESVLGVMTSGHITTAVARGDSPGHIIRHHVLRNASLPVLTVFKPLSIQHTYSLRKVLEPMLALEVVDHLTAEHLQALAENIEATRRQPHTEDERREHRTSELDFHNILAEACPNLVLAFTCRFINDLLKDWVVFNRTYVKAGEQFTQGNQNCHRCLLEAFQRRDREAVGRLMAEHMEEAARHTIAMKGEIEVKFLPN